MTKKKPRVVSLWRRKIIISDVACREIRMTHPESVLNLGLTEGLYIAGLIDKLIKRLKNE